MAEIMEIIQSLAVPVHEFIARAQRDSGRFACLRLSLRPYRYRGNSQ